MKLTSAGANKMIKAWNEDLEGLLKKEEAESRTTYGINEEPLPANYDFARMQQQMDALNQKERRGYEAAQRERWFGSWYLQWFPGID